VIELDHPKAGPIRVTGVPIKLSDTPGAVSTPPPELGQHTREVLEEWLGVEESQVARLEQSGVI